MKLSKLFILLLILLGIAVLSSCIDGQTMRKSRGITGSTELTDGELPDGEDAGEGDKNATKNLEGQDGDISSGVLDDILEHGRAELRHLVDPQDGTYKTKITIPKNFTGYLYISGLNITSLSDKLVSVRFNFGRDLEPVTVQGTIARAQGITPQTDIEVIILDLNNSKPFQSIRLLYDLFDYNDYRDEDGNETKEVVNDPRDIGLFCRGLKLEHDPTFEYSASNTKCDQSGEVCRYAYAKIKDAGLTYKDTDLAITPTEPQLDIGGNGYNNDSAYALQKCLPDNNSLSHFNGVLFGSDSTKYEQNPLEYGLTELTIEGESYVYKGPFRGLSTNLWEISGSALLSDLSNASTVPSGLFQIGKDTAQGGIKDGVYDAQDIGGGYGSFLFPRSGKMALNANIEYYGSSNQFVSFDDPQGNGRELTQLVSSGDSLYVDGCNLRVTNYDSYSNEGISSCNVTANIELLTIDAISKKETILATSTDLKLQLIRPSMTDYQGKEVLYSSMKTCTNGQSCGPNECCFNHRCWSRELVSQCLEDVPVVGNGGTGDPCSSDFECTSFCCDRSTSSCAVHVNTTENKVLCSKSPGQECIAREWCRQENVQNCFVVKTGLNQQGEQQCALRCYNVPTFGICKDGRCAPPPVPTVPTFDPSKPNCAGAIDPPTQFD